MTESGNSPFGILGNLSDLVGIGEGVKGGLEHGKKLVTDLSDGHYRDAVGDGFSVMRDVAGILDSVTGLGLVPGVMKVRYVQKFAALADSAILSAAQKTIEAAKWTTGTGDPDVGTGFSDSAKALNRVIDNLIDAKPADDRWNGKAADEYSYRNDEHRHAVSGAQSADEKISWILSGEAELIKHTRESLDGFVQDLKDLDLATLWLNAVPGGEVLKMTVDGAGAAAALASTTVKMGNLAKESLQNSLHINEAAEFYSKAVEDVSGREKSGSCGNFIFVQQEEDVSTTGRPDRLKVEGGKPVPYVPPKPLEPPQYGPPATPLPVPTAPPPATPLPAPSKTPIEKG